MMLSKEQIIQFANKIEELSNEPGALVQNNELTQLGCLVIVISLAEMATKVYQSWIEVLKDGSSN